MIFFLWKIFLVKKNGKTHFSQNVANLHMPKRALFKCCFSLATSEFLRACLGNFNGRNLLNFTILVQNGNFFDVL